MTHIKNLWEINIPGFVTNILELAGIGALASVYDKMETQAPAEAGVGACNQAEYVLDLR